MAKHSHSAEEDVSDFRLYVAIGLNLLLSVGEVIGGIISGSLALFADALHNSNDCASLGITLGARIIARKQANRWRTFGYMRARVIGRLINRTLLIIIGLYLAYKAVARYFNPSEVQGWPMILAAGAALVIDAMTFVLLYRMSKGGVNLKAGFLHKLADALGSVAVIIAGVAALIWQAYWVDVAATGLIAAYILWQSFRLIGKTISILMESAPKDLNVEDIAEEMRQVEPVKEVYHLHVWELDEQHRALEAHVVVPKESVDEIDRLKASLKDRLKERFGISHSTLEFNFSSGEPEHAAEDHQLIHSE
jgi:cobalt-zinc-cadmium efflux system protein